MRFNSIISTRVHKKYLNLALQGGGAHGAFTWGVLDRLLECENLKIDGISGASAGAVNAVAMASGLLENGRDGARRKLSEIWTKVGKASALSDFITFPLSAVLPGKQLASVARNAMRRFAGHLSPYDLNPMDINPLRTIIQDTVDFNNLRNQTAFQLFISATDASTGRARIFTNKDLSTEAVLASACLPMIFKAVKIEDRYYWDGGYSSNPDLLHLIKHTTSDDTLLIQLNPNARKGLPKTQEEILENVNRITFNQPLIHEIELIYRMRRKRGFWNNDAAESRYRNTRFHLINASHVTARLDASSRLTPGKGVLEYLFRAGREEADIWVEENLNAVGKTATVNLLEEFT